MAIVVASSSALSVAANAVSAEQISGTYQFVGKGRLTLACKASATGLNVTMLAGGIPVVNDQPILWTGTAGTISINDNVLLSHMIPGGKIELKFRNTTGGALTVDYIVLWE